MYMYVYMYIYIMYIRLSGFRLYNLYNKVSRFFPPCLYIFCSFDEICLFA